MTISTRGRANKLNPTTTFIPPRLGLDSRHSPSMMSFLVAWVTKHVEAWLTLPSPSFSNSCRRLVVTSSNREYLANGEHEEGCEVKPTCFRLATSIATSPKPGNVGFKSGAQMKHPVPPTHTPTRAGLSSVPEYNNNSPPVSQKQWRDHTFFLQFQVAASHIRTHLQTLSWWGDTRKVNQPS